MRKGLLLAALGLGAIVVVIMAIWFLTEDGLGDAALCLAVGTVLLVPLALPLLVLRSRWYRLTALICGLLAVATYTALVLAGGFYLWPSALLVLLSVLTPQPS